jgi:hypothetical protein
LAQNSFSELSEGGKMSEATVESLSEELSNAEQRVDSQTLTERVRERPLLSAGLAGLVGFVVGGGAASRTGAAMLTLILRISLRRAATEAFASAKTGYGTAKRNSSS